MKFFDIDQILFTILDYPMSYLEFFGVITGGVAVWLSAKANIWSWPIGMVSVALLFFLFYQVQLYPDMFLQLFFFITNALGWWRWAHPKKEEEDRHRQLKVSYMQVQQLLFLGFAGVSGTFLFGMLASNLHEWVPSLFSKPSSFPYLDSFITVMSVFVTFLMIQKKVECWILWIIIDVVATGVYFAKGINLLGLEYLVFCFIAAFGLWNWIREFNLNRVQHENNH
ncbi:MAG: nicotinamide riboside transporter PnuC [Bacteroidota bacterium]